MVLDFLTCPTAGAPKTFSPTFGFCRQILISPPLEVFFDPIHFSCIYFHCLLGFRVNFAIAHLAIGSTIAVILLCSEFFESTRRT
jgi:hypothetical protein